MTIEALEGNVTTNCEIFNVLCLILNLWAGLGPRVHKRRRLQMNTIVSDRIVLRVDLKKCRRCSFAAHLQIDFDGVLTVTHSTNASVLAVLPVIGVKRKDAVAGIVRRALERLVYSGFIEESSG